MYIIVSAVVGVLVGFVLCSVVVFSSKYEELENLQYYTENLEKKYDEQMKEIERLNEVIRSMEERLA